MITWRPSLDWARYLFYMAHFALLEKEQKACCVIIGDVSECSYRGLLHECCFRNVCIPLQDGTASQPSAVISKFMFVFKYIQKLTFQLL
jgi:hypothetical protein